MGDAGLISSTSFWYSLSVIQIPPQIVCPERKEKSRFFQKKRDHLSDIQVQIGIVKSSSSNDLFCFCTVGAQTYFCGFPVQQPNFSGNFRETVVKGIQIATVPVREGKDLPENPVQILFGADAAAVNDYFVHQGSP
jgi:hypothetical protein